MSNRILETQTARFVCAIVTVTIWLSFATSAWIAVVYSSGNYAAFAGFWLVLLVMAMITPGAKKRR